MKTTIASEPLKSTVSTVSIERLNHGRPILEPTDSWWESGVTFNSAATYLERSPNNDRIIAGLLGEEMLSDPRVSDGITVLHYRARPRKDIMADHPEWNRSFMGLAIFTPTLELIQRLPDPVLSPSDDPNEPDYLGVEDPRITFIDDRYYCVYCGVAPGEKPGFVNVVSCMAESTDLLHWNKLDAMRGNVNQISNKDGVLFPGKIGDSYAMLHRPSPGRYEDMTIDLALSDSMTGPWDCQGRLLNAAPHPSYSNSWIGAGSVPIDLGDCRFLIIYHTGNSNSMEDRLYHLDAAILNFQDFTPQAPKVVVESRLDQLMLPETDWEVKAPYADSIGNVVFTCGSYEYGVHIYIVYGGGDTYILGARIRKDELLAALAAEPCPQQYS